jgi:spermidine/putrescine transport system substrate-binding protein
MRKTWAWGLGGVAVVIVGVLLAQYFRQRDARVLNLLCWTGFDEPQILGVFEAKYGVKVQYKTFVGGDAMYALLTQSHGQYDVVVVDPEYIRKLYSAGRLSTLDPADYDLAQYIPSFRPFPLTVIDGKMVAIPVEFGANALLYNTKLISVQEAQSYAILFSDRVRGKVGVWDWYLPIMGVLSRALGNAWPYDISDDEFARLRQELLRMRPQVATIAPNFPALTTSLAGEDTMIVPGGAGWMAATLQQQGKPIDWAVPKEGGIMWVDSLTIPTDAPHPDVARLYVQWMLTPEAQALLAQKKAFNANVPNAAAYPLIAESVRRALRTDDGAAAEALARQLSVRTLPVRQSERTWQDAWEEFKAGAK